MHYKKCITLLAWLAMGLILRQIAFQGLGRMEMFQEELGLFLHLRCDLLRFLDN